jgi:hypothetical protein
MADSYYTPIADSTFESSTATGSPWGPDTQHAGPPSALLVRAMELYQPRPGSRLGRVGVDILSPVPVAPLDISVTMIRPGKRVELLEARASVEGRDVLTARGWRFTTVAPDFPAGASSAEVAAELPPVGEVNMPGAYMDGYMASVEWRFASGRFDVFGPAIAWARPRLPLLAGEQLSPWQRTMIIVDSASGVSQVAHPRKHPMINCDLTVVMHRDLQDDWVCLDAITTVSPGYGALTRALISDRFGPVGESLQTLFSVGTSG